MTMMGEVVDSAANGFTVKTTITIKTAPDKEKFLNLDKKLNYCPKNGKYVFAKIRNSHPDGLPARQRGEIGGTLCLAWTTKALPKGTLCRL